MYLSPTTSQPSKAPYDLEPKSEKYNSEPVKGTGIPSKTQTKEPETYVRERERHFLSEGHILITTVPTEIITVLGSCVSVCLWDKEKKIAGMNHFLLPGNVDDVSHNLSRGAHATKMLIKSMLNRKCEIGNLEAKIFGGSNSINQFEVGKGNIEMATQILKEAGIRVVARHTGGTFGRKVIFNTRTGKVLMRLLNKSLSELNDEIARGLGV